MGKAKVHLEARTKEERVEMRKRLGSLQSLTVQPATKKRYDKALDRFFDFLKFENLELPRQKVQMDSLVADYLEHLWASGEGRALAADTVAGLQNLEPHLKNNLPTVWRLLKVWSQHELPNRAPPMPETVVHAIVGRALLKEDLSFALSVLLAFYGMLRTGELFNVRPQDVQVCSANGPAVLSLGLTKSGKRQGAAESITVSVFDVVRRLYHWKLNARKPLIMSARQWRSQFAEALQELGLDSFEFRPYSLRRGEQFRGTWKETQEVAKKGAADSSEDLRQLLRPRALKSWLPPAMLRRLAFHFIENEPAFKEEEQVAFWVTW
eukprot:s505_g7.t1